MNRVELMGRLTRDPEFMLTRNGWPMATFTVVVDGEPRWDPDQKLSIAPSSFISCLIFGSEAKPMTTFGKGDKLYVLGELSQEEVELEDGQHVSKTRVKAHLVWPAELKNRDIVDDPAQSF